VFFNSNVYILNKIPNIRIRVIVLIIGRCFEYLEIVSLTLISFISVLSMPVKFLLNKSVSKRMFSVLM